MNQNLTDNREPIILFRPDRSTEEEYGYVIRSAWNSTTHRSICEDNLVIPRYSALPFYKELEEDLQYNGCKMINSYEQFRYIADFHYYEDIADLTFKTWKDITKVSDEVFPVVVKGATNSRKHKWSTQMYAATRRDAASIAHDLKDDVLIGQQQIIYRQYVPLASLEEGISGLNFCDEWRFFFFKNKLVDYGFYWSQLDPDLIPNFDPSMLDLAYIVLERVKEKTNAFVVDIARTLNNNFVVIELNSFEMSGLSLINPESFYKNLYEIVHENL